MINIVLCLYILYNHSFLSTYYEFWIGFPVCLVCLWKPPNFIFRFLFVWSVYEDHLILYFGLKPEDLKIEEENSSNIFHTMISAWGDSQLLCRLFITISLTHSVKSTIFLSIHIENHWCKNDRQYDHASSEKNNAALVSLTKSQSVSTKFFPSDDLKFAVI